jgi:hypothetical protein
MNNKNKHPNRLDPKVITQVELARFNELNALTQEREILRKKLFTALDAGATIEEGHLVMDYSMIDKPHLTTEKLIKALGLTSAQVKELRTQVPTSTFRYLNVHDRNSTAGQAALAKLHAVGKPQPDLVSDDRSEQFCYDD